MSRAATVCLLAATLLAAVAQSASAVEFGIEPGSLTIRTINAEGNPDGRAGAHPDRLQIKYTINTENTGTAAKDILFELPPGFGGNTAATPTCPGGLYAEEECPANTQVGVLEQQNEVEAFSLPIWNIEPAPNEPLSLGTKPFWNAPLLMSIRPTDYGLVMGAYDLLQIPAGKSSVEIWGVPADHQEGTSIPRLPFITTPTRCGPFAVTLRTRSWRVGAPWLSASAESSSPLSGCQDLPFEPKYEFALDNPIADAPTGVRVDVSMIESSDPDGRVQSQIEAMTVDFPAGLTLSPGATMDLSACADAQFGFGTADVPTCPSSSEIGTVEMTSSQLSQSLDGTIFLGQEHPGERIRVLVTAAGPGVRVKLAGVIHTDPITGRLSAVFEDFPQLSFGRVTMSFDGGSHALFASPLTCGSSTSAGIFEPYAGTSAVQSSTTISVGANPAGSQCTGAAPFAPEFIAGSSSLKPGHSTVFSTTLRRRDGEQLPDRFAVTLPPGISAALGAVGKCAEQAAASGACPASTRIGGAVAEIGSGPIPAALSGDVYLTGPYRQAPFGVVIVFPAKLGPFDLGMLTVRGAVRLDQHTGQVTLQTDPLPQVAEGLSIRYRTIGIDLDRPGFIRNPTSCAPTSVKAVTVATSGVRSTQSVPFSLRHCDALGLRPKFTMAIDGGARMHKGDKPGLRIVVRPRREDTNLRAVTVGFPKLLQLDSSALKELCARRDALDGKCPDAARVGTGYARTPLFDEVMKGPIYFAQPKGKGLPGLAMVVKGMGVNLSFTGESSLRAGRLTTDLSDLPDMPLSMIKINLRGGRSGVFDLRANPCGKKARDLVASVATEGQSEAYRMLRVPMRVEPGCHGVSASGLPSRLVKAIGASNAER